MKVVRILPSRLYKDAGRFLCIVLATTLIFRVYLAPSAFGREFDSQITSINRPQALTIDPTGDVWVSGINPGLVSEFEPYPSQNLIGDLSGEGHLTYPYHLTFSATNGDLYVDDNSGNVIDVIQASTGMVKEVWSVGHGSCGEPSVAVDNSTLPSRGRIYAGCSGPDEEEGSFAVQAFTANHEPDHFSETAEYISENHLTGTPSGPFGEVSGLATDGDGDLYVLDDTNAVIDKFAPSGKFIREFTGAGAPEGFSKIFPGSLFPNWAAIAIDPSNGDLLVQNGPKAVDEFSSTGEYIGQLTESTPGHPFGGLDADGIAFNSEGYLYVVDEAQGVVDIFTPAAAVPKVSYTPLSDETQHSAVLNATVDPNGGGKITSCEFQYGHSTQYGSSVPCSPVTPYSGETDASSELTGLIAQTTYHYRILVANAAGLHRVGQDQTFTPHAVAGVCTEPASSPERTAATLHGCFTGNGEDTHYHFEYVTQEQFEQPEHGGFSQAGSTETLDAGSPPSGKQATESFELSGLTPQTIYHYRFLAENSAGSTIGEGQNLMTPPAVTALKTDPATLDSPETVTLHGSFSGDGNETEYYFEYGTDSSYGHRTASASEATNPTAPRDRARK